MTHRIDMGSRRVSRRGLLAAGIAIGAGPMLASRALASPKVSKDCVHYQDVALGGHRCGACRMFQAPSACQNVAGEISDACGCRIWLPKIV